jgi:hypothetical protein
VPKSKITPDEKGHLTTHRPARKMRPMKHGILTLCLMTMATCAPASKPDPHFWAPGDRGVIKIWSKDASPQTQMPTGATFLAIGPDEMLYLDDAVKKGDNGAIGKLESEGQVSEIPLGSHALVQGQAYGYLRVLITDGPRRDARGWISQGWIYYER